MIEEKIIPKNSIGISLGSISKEIKHLLHKKITEKALKVLDNIKSELILIVQNLFLLNDSAKGKIAKNFLNSFYNRVNILIYGKSINVV